ncbi:hypothetical protein C4A77_06690 [Brevibacillus laterosporus]|uniref:Uncharacterized protein n=1 Tax=Brevibacillus laterosporus TaxID=1465 RepID=A0AAP8QEH3_BRELA|nr:hypothetical protein C4A77_06690 [Brevibacillus laterosporus]
MYMTQLSFLCYFLYTNKRIHLAVIFSLPFCYFFEHYGNYTEIYISPDIQAMSTKEAKESDL